MNKKARKAVLTEAFANSRNLIASIAWHFWQANGGDLDDLIAQANLLFIDAVDSYDPTKNAKLSTWIFITVRNGLLEYVRNRNVYKTTYTAIDDEFVDTYPASSNDISVMEFIDDMTQDAHIVLSLFLETPREILVNIRNDNKRIDHARFTMRNRLWNRLRQNGWSKHRTTNAFKEIKSLIRH